MANTLSIEQRLNELKRMLVSEPEFTNTYKYFFDRLGNDVNFMKSGGREMGSNFEFIIKEIAESMIGQKVVIKMFLTMVLPEQRFVHGVCHSNGRLTTFFFFEEISMGMVAMMNPGGEDTLFARFTTFKAPNKNISLHTLASSGSTVH